MKSVYHIAQTSPVWPNGGWEQGFLQNGYKYGFTDWQGWKAQWGEKAMKAKVLLEIEAMKPDFVFMQVQRGGVFEIELINEIQKTAPVVNFNEDVRDDIQWMVDLGCFLSIMTNTEDVSWLKEKGCNAEYMLPTFDERYYRQEGPSGNFGDIVFIGNKYSGSNLKFPCAEQRDQMVEFMSKNFGKRFKAYGRGYGDFLDPKKEAEAYRGCLVAVTHNNYRKADYTSDRLLRAMACGAVVAAQETESTVIDTLFMNSYGWTTLDELGFICETLLSSKPIYKMLRSIQQEEISFHRPVNKIKHLEFIVNDYK